MALLFSLFVMPRVYTRVLAPMLALLHFQVIPIEEYLEYLLLMEQSTQVLTRNVA